MTTELEQEFYDTFDIEPEYKTCIFKYCKNKKEYDCDNCGDRLWHYPEITAEKLLAMICVLNEHYCNNYQCATMLVGDTIEQIKECVLKDCIEQSQHIKSKIQQLFKEQTNEK